MITVFFLREHWSGDVSKILSLYCETKHREALLRELTNSMATGEMKSTKVARERKCKLKNRVRYHLQFDDFINIVL